MALPAEPRAVVTGGGSGLGRAFCVELARRGARLLIADKNLTSAEETAKLLGVPDDRAHPIACDVSSLDEVEALAKEADRRFGGTDLIVNNAGVAVGGPMDEIPIEDWRWIVSVNLFGVVHGCKAFIPRFKARRSGHVLNVASAAGLVSAGEMAPYNMTKSAVVALSETIFLELAPFGIGVTVLCPTFFRTGIVDSARHHGSDRSAMSIASQMMDRSKIQADDVARMALDAAARNKLYVVPMADGRWMWRMKRLMPEAFHRSLVPRAIRMVKKRFVTS